MHYGPKPKPVYGNTVVYDKSFAADKITLLPDTLYTAPEGKQLTMTVNGVETELKAGEYVGDVRFTVTDDLGGILKANTHPNDPDPQYRAALYVDESGIVESKSVLAAMGGCEYDASGVSAGKLVSEGPLFNGIVVNDCEYEIKNLDVKFTGRGGDDFNGYGAAIVTAGKSKVHVDGCKIETWGCIRGAMTAGGESEVLFENSTVECHGGTLEEQEITDGMNEVPWVLGLSGNCRSTNLVQGSKVTYRNCDMKAYGWGVLSTDAAKGTVLTAEKCRIEVNGPSGYGSYSVGDATNIFTDCTFIVPDYALVIAEAPGGGAFFHNTMVTSARFGLMWHSHTNPEAAVVDQNSAFYTGMTTFLFKGCGAKLNVSESLVKPGNGVILQMMDSDDAGLFASEFVVCDNSDPEKDPDFDLCSKHDGDVQASFSKMAVEGSFYNARTGKKMAPAGAPGQPPAEPAFTGSNLHLEFNECQVKGVISAAEEHHTNVAPGEAIKEETDRLELGQVTNEAKPAVNNGVVVLLMNGSSWTVTGDSYLTGFVLDDKSSLIGTLTVDGEAVQVEPNKFYTGALKLSAL